MKATASFMIILMSLISVIPGNARSVAMAAKQSCCKYVQNSKCGNHTGQGGKANGLCMTRVCCNINSFTKSDSANTSVYSILLKKSGPGFYLQKDLPAFFISFWNPPKA